MQSLQFLANRNYLLFRNAQRGAPAGKSGTLCALGFLWRAGPVAGRIVPQKVLSVLRATKSKGLEGKEINNKLKGCLTAAVPTLWGPAVMVVIEK